MTTAPLVPVPTAVLLQRMRAATARRTAAEVELVELASAWAHAHTIAPASSRLDGYDPLAPLGMDEGTATAEEVEWDALPTLRWDAAASFAAAQGLTTAAGADLLRDVLTLELRMPLTWARIRSGQVAVWRGRRIAQRVLGHADDVVALVDYNVAPKAHSIGVTGIDHLIDTVMLQRHAEQVELEAMEAAEQRYARRASPADTYGLSEYVVRGDHADLTAFDTTIARLAAALKRDGSHESLDVRRSIAVGVIADPARAQAPSPAGPAATTCV